MPNLKSAKKRLRQSLERRSRNRAAKSRLKTAIKKFDSEVAQNTTNAGAQYSVTTSAIDKAVSKGVIHKNAANRKKARLAKAMAKANA